MVGQARIGIAIGLLALCAPAVALADPPATAGVLQLEAGFRYGIDLGDTEVGPWGPGVGIGVGYTLDSGIYFGGLVEYFFGQRGTEGVAEVKENLIQLVGEGGYDLGLSEHWVARGKGFVGGARLAREACSSVMIPGGAESCTDASSFELGLGPGAALMYLGKSFSFSVDARYELVMSDPAESAVILAAGIGF